MNYLGVSIMNDKVKLALEISPAVDQTLHDIAKKTQSTIGDVLLKSIILLKLAIEEIYAGNHLGILNKNREVVRDIIGLYNERI